MESGGGDHQDPSPGRPDAPRMANLESRQRILEVRTERLERAIARLHRLIDANSAFYERSQGMTAMISSTVTDTESQQRHHSQAVGVPHLRRMTGLTDDGSSLGRGPQASPTPSSANPSMPGAFPYDDVIAENDSPHVLRESLRESMRSLHQTIFALQGQAGRGAEPPTSPRHKPECSSCFEEIEEPAYVSSCLHTYCVECLRELFLRATRDESVFPARCCGIEFRYETIRLVLTHHELQEYDLHAEEYTASPRVYCAEPTCSTFIRPSAIKNEHGTCSRCHKKTHITCKALAHPGRECPVDEAQKSVINLAEKNNWRRCYHCHAIVELRYGCNEVRCRCGHTFCYQCGSKWKTCECQNLYRHNTPMTDQPLQWSMFLTPGDLIGAPVPQANPFTTTPSSFPMEMPTLETTLRQLRRGVPPQIPPTAPVSDPTPPFTCEDHREATWTSRGGRMFRCSICSVFPPQIFECDACHMRVCSTCSTILSIGSPTKNPDLQTEPGNKVTKEPEDEEEL
ncbi:hypothetical protein N7539_004306 [Penicillium diatomitis]|uniref:RBR-type E3 ubiquitin transferase n=1 Tax=Penicillium diatomitis TaxID=2819901 RepID=A0A9X0BY22_9EURO|nr:uncharacterized protein N7539_004306 [Penicillium diatomitis]KAJ5489416.1 hypothetical protein N7539_004306 [Penicillium diatomitis]